MSSQPPASYLLGRVLARAGLGIWRHRGGVLLAAVVSAALVGYVALSGTVLPDPATLAAGGSVASNPRPNSSGDCADTAMAAIANKAPAAVQRAYQCMDPTFQQRVTEQAFVQQMQQSRIANVDKLARVGDYRSPSGGSMVYYALDGGGQSVGYIVYLGQDGKVLKIE